METGETQKRGVQSAPKGPGFMEQFRFYYSKLPAAKPTVFTRIRVVCKPDVRFPVPEILNLFTPKAGSGRSLHPAASPLLSLHPKDRNFWDGQKIHPLLLLQAGVGRAGKTSEIFLSHGPKLRVSLTLW